MAGEELPIRVVPGQVGVNRVFWFRVLVGYTNFMRIPELAPKC